MTSALVIGASNVSFTSSRFSEMGTEIRHYMGIGDDQAGSPAGDGKCGEPIVSFRQLSRERQPNALLIVKKIFRQAAP